MRMAVASDKAILPSSSECELFPGENNFRFKVLFSLLADCGDLAVLGFS